MSNPTFYTRIQNKYDTKVNLDNSTFIPKSGELIGASDAGSNGNYKKLKIGDGTNKYSNLQFVDQEAIDLANAAQTSANNAASAASAADGKAVAAANNSYVNASISGKVITLTKGDGSTKTLTTQDTVHDAAGTSLGLVKSGGDVTISNGIITVNDNSHNHNYAGSSSVGGAANSAIKLATARTIGLSGGATGTATSFDGSGNITIPVTSISPSHIAEGYTTKGIYINTHPENSPVIIPFINNDLTYLLKKGGSAVVKYDDVTQNIDISPVFDGSAGYWMMNPTNITSVTIELTLHKVFTWWNNIYVDCGANNWRAKTIKIEVINTNYANDVWTTKGHVTNHSLSQYKITFNHTPVGATNSGAGFNKIRFTFSDWNQSDVFRIAALGLINCVSHGVREVCLPRDGGELYGSIIPYTNNSYALGTSSKKWNNVYATTFTGNLNGSATKATQDANGNNIVNTYATKNELPVAIENAIANIDNLVFIGTNDAEDTTSGATSLVDADTLGGYNASHFATQEDLTNIVNGTTKVAKATTADSATSATSANSATSAISATKATQDGSGNVITSTYATKSQLGTQVTYSLSGTTLTITTK